jgi:hypothetical protein
MKMCRDVMIYISSAIKIYSGIWHLLKPIEPNRQYGESIKPF